MIKLDLIELADLTKPKELAQEIILQNPDIELPIPLDEICEKSGISDIRYKDMDSFEGALVANDTKSEGIILINVKTGHQRQRFTLGHELGHFLIPRHGSNMRCSLSDLFVRDSAAGTNERKKIEMEANTFSAEISMPETIFRKIPQSRCEPSIDHILTLAALFDVSFEACAKRYVELHDFPIAIVFSHETKVRYSNRNNELPFWIIPSKGDKVPALSATSKANSVKNNTVSIHETESTVWLDLNKNWLMPDNLVEEVYMQENSYSATLLWFEDEIEEVE